MHRSATDNLDASAHIHRATRAGAWSVIYPELQIVRLMAKNADGKAL